MNLNSLFALDIRKWFIRGKGLGATHLIVVCDEFSYDYYPVFVMPEENVRDIERQYKMSNMQRVMENYNLSLDMEKQVAGPRAFNY